MREHLIRIQPFQYISYERIVLHKKAGGRAKAVIKGMIRSSDYKEYLDLLRELEVWVKVLIYEEEGREEKILFYGLISFYELEHRGEEKQLTLHLVDGASLMDVNKHIRVFQNPEETYRSLFQAISLKYQRNGVISIEEAASRIDRLYVQYLETDWEFASRIAAEIGTFLVPDVYTGGIKYYVGLPRREIYPWIKEMDCQIKNDKFQNYVIKTRDIYELGEGFQTEAGIFYIYQSLSFYAHGELLHEYHIARQKDLVQLPFFNEHISGVSLSGEVVEVEKSFVKVKLESDEYDCGRKKWFSFSTVYSTPEGAGWYCMPEPGDAIRLHFPDCNETHAYVISSVHLDTEGGRDNPDYKSFKSKYGKEIMLAPDKIVITNNAGNRIVLSDHEGIIMETDKTIRLSALDKILINSKEGKLTIKSTDMIKLRQKDTMIKLDDDILFSGGEFRIQ